MAENNTPQAVTKRNWLSDEPVALMYLIQTLLALAMGFGFNIDPIQMALILTFTGAALSYITRQNVTPFVSVGTTPMAPTANTPDLTPITAQATPNARAQAPVVADEAN